MQQCNECKTCNVCRQPARCEAGVEAARVYSNVRKFKDEYFTVWRCRNCGSLHCKEAADLDRYYAGYPFANHVMNYPTSRAYRNVLRRLVKNKVRRDHSILDFGCGKGLFVDFLRSRGFTRVDGYDKYSRRFGDTAVLQQRFDVITSHDVIEHLDTPREFFEQLMGSLRDGGLLVVGTPNAAYIDLSQADEFLMELHQPYHRHILSEEALVDMAKEFGLECVNRYYRFYFDTLYPGVNTRFMEAYIRRAGNMIDTAVEKPRVGLVLTSPKLLFFAVAGFFFPPRGNMMLMFRKSKAS